VRPRRGRVDGGDTCIALRGARNGSDARCGVCHASSNERNVAGHGAYEKRKPFVALAVAAAPATPAATTAAPFAARATQATPASAFVTMPTTRETSSAVASTSSESRLTP